MKKVFTSFLLLAALSVPAYLSASAWLEGDGGEPAEQTTTIEVDYTSKVKTDGWKDANGNNAGVCATQFAPAITTKDGRNAQLAENYQTNVNATGDILLQTVTGLANGTYRVSIYANAFYTSGRGFESEMEDGAEDVCYVFAGSGENRKEKFITARIATSTTENDLRSLEDVVVTDGTLVIGLGKAKAGTNWHTVQVYEVTAIVDATELLNTANENYEAVKDLAMQKTVKDALDLAKTAVDAEVTSETLTAFSNAISAAQSSAEAYAAAKSKLDNMKALLDANNVYTAEALENYYGKWAAAFENQTLTADEGNALQDPFAPAGWHSANLTVDDLLLSAWTIGGEQAHEYDKALYINTWSTEGNNDGTEFRVPFFEYWTNDGNSLGANTLTATLTGVEEGLYEVSAWVRVRAKNGTAADDATGISLNVNGGTATDVTEGAPVGESQFNIAEYKAYGQVGEDGNLAITFTIDAENNISWLSYKNVKFKKTSAEEIAYEKALAAIKDGEGYRVFTEVEGTKYYLNTTGYLTDDTQKAATFEFKKVEAAGTPYQFGWNLGCQFTNPSTGGNTSFTNDGHIHTGSQNRDNWERQVFFMNDEGLFAVRATNATDPAWGANTYWDAFNDAELPEAGYSLEPAYVWQIEGFVDKRPEAFAKTQTWAAKLQNIEGLVTAASQWSSNAKEPSEGSYEALTDNVYTSFFHSQWSGTAVGEDHYIQAELPEAQQDFYFYFKKRSQNNNNRPTDLVISGSNDGVEFAEITEITEGLPTDASIIEYISAKISAPEAYKYIRFTVKATNNGDANNGHVFFTFSELYILPADELVEEAVKYMVGSYTDIEIEDIEAIETLDARIDNYFHDVTFELAFNGEIIASETIQQKTGQPVTAPASFKTAMHGLYALTPDVAVIADDTEKVVFTPTWAGPFKFSTDINNAKWYNLDIRGGWKVSKCETEPYTMKQDATDEELASPEYQWAFFPVAGDPLKVVVVNKAAEGQSLTPVDISRHAVVLREGEYAWDIFANADGFVLREVGTENGWVNQAGGGSATSPLAFWDNAAGKTDGGSTFRVSEVPFVILDNMPLTKDMFKNWIGFDATAEPTETTPYWDAAELGAAHSAGNTIYGSGNVTNTDFADVTGAEALRIEGTAGIQLRVLINRQEDNSLIEINPVIGEEGYVDVDLTSYEYVHINAIKLGWGSPAGSVTALILNPTAAEPAGATYAGIIMQSQSHPQAGPMGDSTSDQTVTITEAGEGLVNITFSGFALPMAALGSFAEFTIENVAVTEYEGVTVYLAEDFQVPTSGGQMTSYYNGTLIGAQETAESTPVIKLILQNASTDVCYFGANEEDINRFKERETANNDYSFTVERYAGMGYTPTEAAIDDETFAEIKTVLGVEELTTDMLSFVNPNGTEISYADYMTANYDGWCDAEGTATNWGSTTAICVKFFEALSEGKYSICDMNGADEIGKEYKVTWKLTNGNNSVTYTTVVKFVEAPEVQMTISENVIKASVTYTTDEASYVEKSVELTQEQISAICDELGVESIEGLDVYGYNPSNAELLTNYAGFDGWRDANGDFHNWTGSDAAPACVKFTDGKTFLCYNIAGCEPQTIKCYWAIATESKAVLIEISFTYQYPDGINGIAADVENGKVFNIAGQKTGRVQKGVNIIGGKKVYVK